MQTAVPVDEGIILLRSRMNDAAQCDINQGNYEVKCTTRRCRVQYSNKLLPEETHKSTIASPPNTP